MKWLVAPNKDQVGQGHLDFCWTTPGEILIPSSKCTSGTPADYCGCCRAMSGLISRKATTIGIVKELYITPSKVARQDVIRFWMDHLPAEVVKRFTSHTAEFIAAISDDLWRFPVDSRICFMTIGDELELNLAGDVTVVQGFGV